MADDAVPDQLNELLELERIAPAKYGNALAALVRAAKRLGPSPHERRTPFPREKPTPGPRKKPIQREQPTPVPRDKTDAGPAQEPDPAWTADSVLAQEAKASPAHAVAHERGVRRVEEINLSPRGAYIEAGPMGDREFLVRLADWCPCKGIPSAQIQESSWEACVLRFNESWSKRSWISAEWNSSWLSGSSSGRQTWTAARSSQAPCFGTGRKPFSRRMKS